MSTISDYNEYRFVLHVTDELEQTLSRKENLRYVSNEITNKLKGVEPTGKMIIVPDEKISSVMQSIIPTTVRREPKFIMEATIDFIVEQIKTDYANRETDSIRDVWVLNYGPETGMMKYPKVRTNERRNPLTYHFTY